MSERSDLEFRLASGLRPVSGAWQRLADVTLASLEVSSSQGWALVQLARMGAKTRQADLARTLSITEASLVRTLHQLERAGYVTREADPADRRSNHLVLTGPGATIARGIDDRLIALRSELLDGLSDDQLAACLAVLHHIDMRVEERQGRA